jgi:hypothetical protein
MRLMLEASPELQHTQLALRPARELVDMQILLAASPHLAQLSRQLASMQRSLIPQTLVQCNFLSIAARLAQNSSVSRALLSEESLRQRDVGVEDRSLLCPAPRSAESSPPKSAGGEGIAPAKFEQLEEHGAKRKRKRLE